jgi:hypothetical protein
MADRGNMLKHVVALNALQRVWSVRPQFICGWASRAKLKAMVEGTKIVRGQFGEKRNRS